MDVRTGEIIEVHNDPTWKPMPYHKQMILEPTAVQRRKMRVGRNDKCPCGSGKKFKKCCKR